MKTNHKAFKTTVTYAIIGMLSCLLGCKEFVEIPTPNSQLVTSSVFTNDASATAALTNIYTQMVANNQESPNIAIQNGILSDELTSYANEVGPPPLSLYRNAMSASANVVFGQWENAYKYIYQANAILIALQQYDGVTKEVKNQLTGEAYFIRAFWHFYLTNTYGDVPVALTTDYSVTNRLSKTPRVEVLQQIINDLIAAGNLLSSNYVDASSKNTTTERVRPNKAVATALLARAYLYHGDYANNNTVSYTAAIAASSTVIGNSTYRLCDDLSGPNSVFLKNSTEAIWQFFTPLPSNQNTFDGNDFILLGAPNNYGSYQGNSISPQLMSAFEANDKRKTNWIGSITAGGITYNYPWKYKVQSGNAISEYTMVLRLAEQYLIRAEAKAELNDPTAKDDLNAVRLRAGVGEYIGALDKASMLAAILHERQVELFTEWGHRWYDLNRALNTRNPVNVNTIMGAPGGVTASKGGTWGTKGYQQLYPIPINDIKINNNIKQNPGY